MCHNTFVEGWVCEWIGYFWLPDYILTLQVRILPLFPPTKNKAWLKVISEKAQTQMHITPQWNVEHQETPKLVKHSQTASSEQNTRTCFEHWKMAFWQQSRGRTSWDALLCCAWYHSVCRWNLEDTSSAFVNSLDPKHTIAHASCSVAESLIWSAKHSTSRNYFRLKVPVLESRMSSSILNPLARGQNHWDWTVL